jgi:uracil-DNA glycosylase
VLSVDRARELADLQAAHRACRRCVESGFIARAHPVFSGDATQRILLVGQAPGPVETDESRPFAGRAGRMLMRWFARAGFSDEVEVRHRVYMTSMTTCFPGRREDGSGDRPPSRREVALCASWLDGVVRLIDPPLILSVGALALSRFLPGRDLDSSVGTVFDPRGGVVRGVPRAAPVVLPLPHPSGQSRWLNDPARALLLDRALRRLAQLAIWAERW